MNFLRSCRFIDDECNLKDGGEFARSYQPIYPPQLELKCSHATFLELDITILDGKFVYNFF